MVRLALLFLCVFVNQLSAEVIDVHWQSLGSTLWVDWRPWQGWVVPQNTVDTQYNVFIDVTEVPECVPCFEVIITGEMDISVDNLYIETGMFTGSDGTINGHVFNNAVIRPGWYNGELDDYFIPPVPTGSLVSPVPEPQGVNLLLLFLYLAIKRASS